MRSSNNSKIKRPLCLFSYKKIYLWSYYIKIMRSSRKTILDFKWVCN
nr:MAG TPA: hypothetical protein [Bacteriophage sp.]DAR42010.1 MAG TPA: hypothetical protein [Bacteriophage sp.]